MKTQNTNATLAILSLVADNCYTISAQYKDHQGNGIGKPYTYKVPKDLELEVGDEVVVVAPSTGPTVVICTEVHDEAMLDVDAPFQYKWVAAKVDLTGYNSLVARDASITEKVEKLQRKAKQESRVAQLRESLGLSKKELKALIEEMED